MLTTDIGPMIRPDFYSHHAAAAAQTALIDRVVGDSSNNNNNNSGISQSPRLGFTPSSKCSSAATTATTKLFGDNEILEHPGLRGTPLAMLAAQCNKLSSKSPPPLADAAVGKGFHPWKKSSLLGSITSSSSSTNAVISTTSSSGNGGGGNNNSLQSYSNSSPPQSQLQIQRGLTNNSSSGSYGSSGGGGRSGSQCGPTAASAGSYGTDLYFHGSGNSVGCGDQSPPGFIGKMDAGVYSRVAAYDSWPFNAMAGAHSAIKPDVSSMNGSSWWDAVHGVAAGSGWLDGSGITPAAAAAAGMHHPHHHHHAHQMSNYNDYSSLTHSLAAASHPNILNAGQHLLQDTYKSMLPSQSVGSSVSSPFGLGQASLPQTVPSTRNQRRYTGRATCDCPNCQEAERLGPAGAHLRKKNIHSCHIPGCGKVYGKTSHLKAHLRWHTVKSPSTKPSKPTETTNSSPQTTTSSGGASSSSSPGARTKKSQAGAQAQQRRK